MSPGGDIENGSHGTHVTGWWHPERPSWHLCHRVVTWSGHRKTPRSLRGFAGNGAFFIRNWSRQSACSAARRI